MDLVWRKGLLAEGTLKKASAVASGIAGDSPALPAVLERVMLLLLDSTDVVVGSKEQGWLLQASHEIAPVLQLDGRVAPWPVPPLRSTATRAVARAG